MNPAASSADTPSRSARADRSPVSGSPLRSGSFSADHYADSLMDELFEDVDRILEGVVPSDLADPATDPGSDLAVVEHSQPTVTPATSLQAELDAATDLAIAPDADLDTLPPSELEPFLEGQSEEQDESIPQPLSVFDRLLLLAAAVSVVATVVLGFMLERTWRQAQNPAAPVLTSAQIAEMERKEAFLDYMQDSLEAIDRRASQAQVPDAPDAMPTLTIPGSPANSQTVLERVYVPVYQTPPIAGAPQTGVPQISSAPPSTAATAPATPAPSAPVAAAPTTAYTLVGILDLGDRSAALVNIDGTTQRFQVGESIGASGWTLVSIENQEAVIRRNGEVRSIYVGQVF